VSAADTVALVMSAGVLVYLIVALVFPERF
jgi:K+-transporting ATPase KdpF subunit